jgi:hypothetical protein
MAGSLPLMGAGPSAAAVPAPTLGIAPSSRDVTGGAASFTVTGENLAGNVTVTAPTDFEVSLNNVTYFASRTLVPSGGTLGPGVVCWVRKITPAVPMHYEGNVVASSSGATDATALVTYM